MTRNRVKIVANQKAGTIAYFFQNEKGEWKTVSDASPLAKKEYRSAKIVNKAQAILEAVNEAYNYGGRGVDVLFEGTSEDFEILHEAAKNHFAEEDIVCRENKLKIAVAGKISSGKTTVVEELSRLNNIQFRREERPGCTVYQDKSGSVGWYVLEGLELGKENLDQTRDTLDRLARENASVFIYCVSSARIERGEEQLILHMRNTCHSVRPLILLTQSYERKKAERYAGEMQKRLGGVRVIPILARDKITRGGKIPAFGLDQASKYIFEGIYHG